MKSFTHKSVVFIDSEATMEEVVLSMRDHNISSVLVTNRDKHVVGIITERDIVQKFTLLPQADKMSAKAGAFMNRPVHFVSLHQLESDVKKLLQDHHLRHFPISLNGGTQSSDILGIITVTDLARNYLMQKDRQEAAQAKHEIVIACHGERQRSHYKLLFQALNFQVVEGPEASRLFSYATDHGRPVLCDLDGLPVSEAQKQLRLLKDFKGTFILLSSHDELVERLRPSLEAGNHHIARKPLDMSLILKIL